MHIVYFLASVGLAPGEVNAEVSFEVIVVYGLCSVRHSVHGSSVHMSVILDQHSPTLPAPAAVDGLHGGSVILGFGLRVQVVGSAPPFAGEDLACLDILYLEGGALRNLFASAVKPVQFFGFPGFSAGCGIRCIGFLRVFGVQLGQGFGPDLPVIVQAVSLLEALDRALGSLSVVAVDAPGVIA